MRIICLHSYIIESISYKYKQMLKICLRDGNLKDANIQNRSGAECNSIKWVLCSLLCPVGWGCRIHRLHLCKEVRPTNEFPAYDTKQSDGKVPLILELWGIQSTPSLPLLPGPLRPGVVAPDTGPIYGLDRTNGILMLNWIVWLNWIAWNRNVFLY